MENILSVYEELIYIWVNRYDDSEYEKKFENLLNNFLGMCSQKLEIPDFFAALNYLFNMQDKKMRDIIHSETNQLYSIDLFSVRTTSGNKGIDVIYSKEIKADVRFIEGTHKLVFSKSLKDVLMTFVIESNFMLYIIIAAKKAEELCYSGKGFLRNGQESFMIRYSQDLEKRYIS